MEGVLAGLGHAVPPLSPGRGSSAAGEGHIEPGSRPVAASSALYLPAGEARHERGRVGAHLEDAGPSDAPAPLATSLLGRTLEVAPMSSPDSAGAQQAASSESDSAQEDVGEEDHSASPVELDTAIPLRVSLTIEPA